MFASNVKNQFLQHETINKLYKICQNKFGVFEIPVVDGNVDAIFGDFPKSTSKTKEILLGKVYLFWRDCLTSDKKNV